MASRVYQDKNTHAPCGAELSPPGPHSTGGLEPGQETGDEPSPTATDAWVSQHVQAASVPSADHRSRARLRCLIGSPRFLMPLKDKALQSGRRSAQPELSHRSGVTVPTPSVRRTLQVTDACDQTSGAAAGCCQVEKGVPRKDCYPAGCD